MPLEEFTYSVIFRGVILVVFSLKVFPRYQKAVGPLHACKVGLIGGMPCAVLVPAASLFSFSRTAQQVRAPGREQCCERHECMGKGFGSARCRWGPAVEACLQEVRSSRWGFAQSSETRACVCVCVFGRARARVCACMPCLRQSGGRHLNPFDGGW